MFILGYSFLALAHLASSCAPPQPSTQGSQGSFSKLRLLYGIHPKDAFTFNDGNPATAIATGQQKDKTAAMDAALMAFNDSIKAMFEDTDNNLILSRGPEIRFNGLYDNSFVLIEVAAGDEAKACDGKANDKATKIWAPLTKYVDGSCNAEAEDWPPTVEIDIDFARSVPMQNLQPILTKIQNSIEGAEIAKLVQPKYEKEF